MMRAANGLLGVVCALACAEFAVRVQDPVLPSLRGGLSAFVPKERPSVVALEDDIPACIETDTNNVAPIAWKVHLDQELSEAHTLLFAGDSVTLGQGVRPIETYAVELAKAYAEAHNVSVEVVNAGVNAAGYCGVVRAVHHHHAKQRFDRTVVTLFADDLEQRAIALDGDHIRINPVALDGWVASMASHSYVFNWLWYTSVSAAVYQSTKGGTSPPAHVMLPGRSVPAETLQNLARSIEGLAEVNPVWLLVAPAGLSLCPSEPDPSTECGWMVADLERIETVLNSTGARWVDLRHVHSPEYVLDIEQDWWQREGRLPVHPNSIGHRALAEAAAAAVIQRSERTPEVD